MPRKNAVKSALVSRNSFQWKVAAYLIIFSTSIVCILTVLAHSIASGYSQQHAMFQVDALAMSKVNAVESRLRTDSIQTRLIATRPEFVDSPASLAALQGALQNLYTELVRRGAPILGIGVFNSNNVLLEQYGKLPEQLQLGTAGVVPVVSTLGWEGYGITVPVTNPASQVAWLTLYYGSTPIADSLAELVLAGGEVLVAQKKASDLILIEHQFAPGERHPLYLGSMESLQEDKSVIAKVFSNKYGVEQTEDYRGIDTYSAYRYLPTFGWALIVKQDVKHALASVRSMTATLSVVSILLIALSILVSILISRHITGPLRKLSAKVNRLGPGHWAYRREKKANDEIEVLDNVVADLSKRLKNLYENLEEEVKDRTKELVNQYQKDRTILESISQGMVVVDKNGIVTEANPAALKMIGTELEGKPAYEVLQLYRQKHLATKVQHPVLQTLKNRKQYNSSAAVQWALENTASNEVTPVIFGVTPIMKGRKLLGAVAMFYDITEERRIDNLKSEFISLASHQLRTPLSTIQWYIEILTSEGEAPLNIDQLEYITEMDTATKRMIRLVDTLLQATHLEGKKVKTDKEELNLTEYAKGLGEDLCRQTDMAGKKCSIKLPKKDYFTKTDGGMFHIVFQNLFSNAVKYTQKNGRISFSFKASADEYVFAVADNGVGIPKEDQKRIFSKLYRASNVLAMDTDGNGLGLYINSMVMKNLGGRIRFTSQEGKGATFYVTLPRKTTQGGSRGGKSRKK